MPRIAPIPFEDLNEESRRIIDDGFGEGLYSTQVPLQIFAYRTPQLASVHQARTAWGGDSLLGGRILELVRIRSAQLGECQPCMQSRKHDSITDEDVACLLDMEGGGLTEQERLAVKFMDLLSADHHAIDREFYAELAEVFTAAQIIELGLSCAGSMGMHRFIHTLEVFGTDEPVIRYSPDQVDSRHEASAAENPVPVSA